MKFRAASIVFIILNLILVVFVKNPLPFLIALAVLYLAIVAWGSFDIRLNFFTRSISRQSHPAGKLVALTFDDGPTEVTSEFLSLLKKFNAKATFFCIGKQIETHPEILEKIKECGHEIGNHSYSHSNSTGFLSTKMMKKEIELTDLAIFKFTGIQTQLYRPPFGVTNPNIASAIHQLGKKSIGWNVRSLDTVLKNEHTIAQRVLKKTTPGSIILMHDTSKKSLRALEILLLILQKEDYKFATVSELLKSRTT